MKVPSTLCSFEDTSHPQCCSLWKEEYMKVPSTPWLIWGHQPSSTLQSLERGIYEGAKHSVAHLKTPAILNAAVSEKRNIWRCQALCGSFGDTSHPSRCSLWKKREILVLRCKLEVINYPQRSGLWKEKDIHVSSTLWHIWAHQLFFTPQSLKKERKVTGETASKRIDRGWI